MKKLLLLLLLIPNLVMADLNSKIKLGEAEWLRNQ